MFYNTDGTNTPFSPIIYLFIYYSFYLFLIEVLDYCFYFYFLAVNVRLRRLFHLPPGNFTPPGGCRRKTQGESLPYCTPHSDTLDGTRWAGQKPIRQKC